ARFLTVIKKFSSMFPELRGGTIWCLLIAALIGAAAIRLRLRDVPLERDEGEYAYAGQLLLQGIPPFKLGYNMKLAGPHATYALVMFAFGQTIPAIRIGLTLLTSGTSLLLFLIAKRFWGYGSALATAVSFSFLSLLPGFQGIFAHATH